MQFAGPVDESENSNVIPLVFLLGVFCYLTFIHFRLSIGGWIGLLWLFAIWASTFFSHMTSGFISPDEVYFTAQKVESFFANRSLWLLINSAVSAFADDTVKQMRILNLGFLVLLYISAVTTFRTIPPLILAVCLSYAACVAALNLRDVAILLGTVHLLRPLGKVGHHILDTMQLLVKEKWAVLFLFLLRPQMAVLLVASTLRIRVLFVLFTATFLFLQTESGMRYFYNYSYYTQNFSAAITTRAEEKEYERTEPSVPNIAYWTARFVFAPDPISIASRLLTQAGEYKYGTFDLAVRTINRFVLYGLMLMILYQIARAPKAALGVLSDNLFAINFGVSFSLLYALFNFGASHERIKMILVVLLLYLFDRLRVELKRPNYARNAHVFNSHKLSRL